MYIVLASAFVQTYELQLAGKSRNVKQQMPDATSELERLIPTCAAQSSRAADASLCNASFGICVAYCCVASVWILGNRIIIPEHRPQTYGFDISSLP